MEIIVGDKEYKVKDITLSQYELLKSVENISDLQLIAVMTGAPVEELKKAKLTDITFVSKFLRGQMLLQDEIEAPQEVVVFNGKKYGLIKPHDITYDEFVNLEVFMAEDPVDLVKITTHLYKPLKTDDVGENRKLIDYDLQECLDRMPEFKNFPLKTTLSALFFLTYLGKTLMDYLLGSMESQMKSNPPTSNLLKKTETPKK